MKRYLRTAYWVVVWWIVFGFLISLGYDAITAFYWGAICGLITGPLYARLLKARSKFPKDFKGATRYTCNYVIRTSLENAAEVCLEALGSLKRKSEIIYSNTEEGLIVVRTKYNTRNPSDIIIFEFEKVDNKTVKIDVYSKPYLWITLWDLGQNYLNITNIGEYLKRNSEVIHSAQLKPFRPGDEPKF